LSSLQNSNPLLAILWAGFTCGTLDISAALVVYRYFGRPPMRLLQARMAHSMAQPSRLTAITSASRAAPPTCSSSTHGKMAPLPSKTSSNWRKAKTTDVTGTSYPAGLAFSPNGEFVYVAENVGDRLAVVNAATGEITQRFSTEENGLLGSWLAT
jgi:hypothetical protein